MNAVQNINGQTDYAAVPVEELKDALRTAMNAVADKCLEVARIIKALEDRGEDLSDVRKMVGWAFHVLRRMATGQVSPRAFQVFAGCKALLEAVSNLKAEDQEKLARGEKVPLVNSAGTCHLVDPLGLSRSEIQQVFAPDHIRTAEEQSAYRRAQVAKLGDATKRKATRPVPEDEDDEDDEVDLPITANANPLLRTRNATPKDLAEMVAEMVTGHPEPEAVVGELLRHRTFRSLLEKAKIAERMR